MSDPESPLETLLAEALIRFDAGGDTALEQFLASHPDHAGKVRLALTELRRADLLGAPAAGLPRQFGEFVARELLGEGGMGVVYLAEQSSLGREVAVKVVRPELLLFEGARERFRREIDAVARLEHPAIVPILATGTAGGVPWYAMPRLRGASGDAVVKALGEREPRTLTGADLQQVLEAQQAQQAWHGGAGEAGDPPANPWWQVMVTHVRHAALGIHHAHARGVLHRDLKPSNLMLTTDGRAIVLDFGLAQAGDDERLTRTGAAAGSPAFMAPEQLRSEGADPRTDVYGLGATLHCLLGLRPPFPLGDGAVLRNRILAGEREPLRERSGAPPELLLVVDTAMDVERGRRYASAKAFADDLQAVLDGRPITARRLPYAVRARRFARRHRALTAAAAVSSVFVLLLPALLLWQQRLANADLAAEVARTDAANRALSGQVARSDRSMDVTIDAVENLLGRVALEKLRNLPAVQTVAAGLLEDALALFDRLADDETHGKRVRRLRQRTLLEAGFLATTLGRFDQARGHLGRALDSLQGELTPAGQLQRAKANRWLVFLDYRTGKTEGLTERLAAVRAEFAAIDSEPEARQAIREQAFVAELEAGLAGDRGDRPAVLLALRQQVALLERAPSRDALDVSLCSAKIALGANLRDFGHAVESRPILEQVKGMLATTDFPEIGWPVPRVLLAMVTHELASLDYDEQHFAESGEGFRAALALFDALVRDYPDDPGLRRHRGRTANLLAAVLHQDDLWAEARPLLEQACRDQEFVLARDPRDRRARRFLANHLRTLSVGLRSLQDWPALELAARALGAMPGYENTGRAARDLLRCVEQIEPARRQAVRNEAIELLVKAVADGMPWKPLESIYDPVRQDPRFEALVKKGGR